MSDPTGYADLLAHGLGGRSDLPIPLWLAVYGATAAVVISFVALARSWTRPKFTGPMAGRSLSTWLARLIDAPMTRLGGRLVGLALFAIVVLAAWLGPDDSRRIRRRPASTCGGGSDWYPPRCCSARSRRCSARSAP